MLKTQLTRGLTAALLFGSLAAFAVPAPARADDAGALAARLSYVQGDVAVQHGDASSNVAGTINAPLLAGDALTTGPSARAEVQIDGDTMVRLDHDTQVRFAALDQQNRDVQIAQGTMNVDLLQDDDVVPTIDTPSLSFRPDGQGRYRVTVTRSGDTYVTVRAGSADLLLPQGEQTLDPGTTMLVQGSATAPTYHVVATIALDDWDSFNSGRDSTLAAALSAAPPTVADDYTDYAGDDLSSYGQWVYDPAYGEVWAPYQQSGWAPYRDGSWVWEAGFGWTWVSYEPWGWAPYHYGRWFYNGGHGWCWDPPVGPRVGWAPALVGWVSFGSGDFNLSLGFGDLAWVPLAPWEIYRPWYGAGWGGGPRIVGVTNLTLVNYYGNAAHGGLTTIGGRYWRDGDFRGHTIAVSAGNLRRAEVIRGTVPMVPTARNLAFTQRRLPASLQNRTFAHAVAFTGRTAAPMTHQSFAQEARGVRSAIANRQVARGAEAAPSAVHPMQQAIRSAQAERPVQTHAQVSARANGDAWAGFNGDRGTNASARFDAAAHGSDAAARFNGTEHETVNRGNATDHGDAWTRFSSERGSYSAPQRSYDSQQYGGSQRSYDSQQYSGSQRSYDSQRYSAPQRSSGSQQYSGSQRSYDSQRYSAPQRSSGSQRYSAPQRSSSSSRRNPPHRG